ncbi:MAG: hypothetical protein M3Z15_10980, partial [Pseudomonadota bacterium]|nr:hypothetical protein [Pseudomonadota bacterium]
MSVYDGALTRRIGPLSKADVARFLVAEQAFEESGACLAIEKTLAQDCSSAGAAAHVTVSGDLGVHAVPVIREDSVVAVIVYGWTFERFASSLGCQQIGRRFGLDGVKLWARARLESPVTRDRMAVFAALLDSLIGSAVRHAHAVDELVRLARLREVFLASVSHELRSPLQAMSMRVEVLLRKPLQLSDEVRTSIEKIKNHLGAQTRLVADLLDASRTLTGSLQIKKEPTSLQRVLEQA